MQQKRNHDSGSFTDRSEGHPAARGAHRKEPLARGAQEDQPLAGGAQGRQLPVRGAYGQEARSGGTHARGSHARRTYGESPSSASRVQRTREMGAQQPRTQNGYVRHPQTGNDAYAYRRTNDGSGYAPASPGGGNGGKGKGGKTGSSRTSRGPWRVVFWIALAVFVVSLAVLGALFFSYWQGQNAYDKIADQAFEAPDDIEGSDLASLTVDWDALRAINSEVAGWIYIPGTVVNYPIVHTDNDEYYLDYNFNGERGWGATFGTIFLQAANNADFSDANNIIYGHHLRNGSMFACVAQFVDAAQFNSHRTIYLLTPEGNYKLRTFSLVHCSADDPLAVTAFKSTEEQTEYVQDKMERTVVTPEGDVPAASGIDHTFALVTCDSLPSDGRYVLYSYVEETTVAGEHAAGQATSASSEQSDEEDAAAAVSDASEELAAA